MENHDLEMSKSIPNDAIQIGAYISFAPLTPWQQDILNARPFDLSLSGLPSFYKPIIAWKKIMGRSINVANATSPYTFKISGIGRFWYEPVNPFQEKTDRVLQLVLYFEDWKESLKIFDRAEIEEIILGLRINAAIESGEKAKAAKAGKIPPSNNYPLAPSPHII